jgi:PAS domain S-box-containing protein
MQVGDAQLQSILDSLDEGLLVVDHTGRVLRWNQPAEKIHEFSQPTGVAMNFERLAGVFEGSTLDGRVLSPEEWPVSRVLRGERLRNFECVLRRLDLDGWQRILRFGGTPIFDDAGRCVLAVVTFTDITAQRRSDEIRKQSEERARILFENIADALLVRELNTDDAAGRFIEVNDVFCERLGYSREELLSMTPADIDDPASGISVTDVAARLMREKNVVFEQIHVAKDGTRIPVEVHARLISLHGRPAEVALVRDLREQKRSEQAVQELEQQIRHSQKLEAVGRLAGGIAHDFNNLLMVIRCYTEIIEDSLPAYDPLRKNTQAITQAADRAASLTRQMLAFSRKQVLSPVALNLNAAVADSARMLQRVIGEDIELRVVPAEPAWIVRADPDQIAQVLMNLSVNARDAMPEGGTLTIATSNFTTDAKFIAEHPYVVPGDYAVFSVTDTGVGITKDVQERMFEPFFTTKSVGKGTGLGLSTVYGIVKQSGGYLFVESEPGHGACFTVYLPRVMDAVPGTEPTDAEWTPRGSGTLLIVEDEDALRESICEFLVSMGYTVLSAKSGQRALTTAQEFSERIDLMVTDVVMPKMGGRELAQAMTQIRPELKTLYMSGYTDDAVVRHGVQEAGVAFLQKPFSLATLARRVREMLHSPQHAAQD